MSLLLEEAIDLIEDVRANMALNRGPLIKKKLLLMQFLRFMICGVDKKEKII